MLALPVILPFVISSHLPKVRGGGVGGGGVQTPPLNPAMLFYHEAECHTGFFSLVYSGECVF